ncbi:hypothetical protein [Polaromonas sp.]|uniref:secretion/conjugation apparatus DotM-related subunit n=1 Tax=Polaromonas sp. TaxID=1869339 RepID=UPI00352A4893
MATGRKGSAGQNSEKETLLEAGIAIGLAFAVLLALLWFFASHKIVYFTTPGLRWLGIPWSVFQPGKWEAINEAYVFFRNQPRSIPLPNYMAFANDCLRPLAMILSAAAVAYLVVRVGVKSVKGDLRRKLEPMQAAKEIAKVFPSILPVLHLGPDLVANKLPLWRRQTFPEDIWQNEKIQGRPLAAGGTMFRDRVETYYRGGEVKDGPHQMRGGRRWSKMLGFQVVDLLVDAANQDKICFPDRFSSQGKVLFAILCAHAFGGRQGKLDYQKACDELNRTCAGQANGLPNLKVAQWIYAKYRMDPSGKSLFAVHHWEFTYLFALFLKAKKAGKATHTDFLWLKPLDRILFYGLNTVGRAVPHAEAGTVFAMFDYETKCAKLNRLPLRMRKDGELEANICVHTAVEGMGEEFARYQASTEDDEDWWMKLGTWTAAERMAKQRQSMKAEMAEMRASQQQMATVPVEPDTPFDIEMNAKAKAEESEAILRASKIASGTLDEIF